MNSVNESKVIILLEMITWSYQTSPFNSQTKFVILLTVNHLYLLSSLIWLILYWYRKGKFCLGHWWELKGQKETVALEQALIIHATGRAFLRRREDLRGSERGLPGCGTRPFEISHRPVLLKAAYFPAGEDTLTPKRSTNHEWSVGLSCVQFLTQSKFKL